MNIIDQVKFDRNGLVTAIVQDYENSEILMVAYMNVEALRKTIELKQTHFWSRSRQKMWLKGETSGNIQRVKSMAIDCDGDAILIKVAQKSGACHMGYKSCFYRQISPDGNFTEIIGEKLFDPKSVY